MAEATEEQTQDDAAHRVRWLSEGEHALPAGSAWLSPRERERAATLRFTKRRNDFLLGRWVAKRAVARALDLAADVPESLAGIEVRNASDGAPEAWIEAHPAALRISITDRAGWGVCALHASAAVGCDLEMVEARSDAFVADYLTPAEQARVNEAAPGDARALLANLFWSAKESALKVLRTGLRRDTRSVEVELEPGDGIDDWKRLEVRAVEGLRFPGWWRRYGDFVLTVAADRETPPPRSLLEPPALARAAPSHRWLAAPLVR